jgi:mono/diheme cytochrome c family protein
MIARRLALATLVVALPAAPLLAADAAKIFATSCAPCHGKQGQPNAYFTKQGVRNFTDPDWQKAATDAEIAKTIREGKEGTLMASFEKEYSDEEIEALVAYVRKLGAAKKK